MAEVFEPVRILASLRSHGVSYVLVGGLGAAVHGASLDTDDVDIFLPGDTENLARLSLALQQLVAEQRPPTSEADHQVSFDTPFGPLDIIENDEEFAVLNAGATDVNVGRGVVTRVASLDDLARLKRGSDDLQGAGPLDRAGGGARGLRGSADLAGRCRPRAQRSGRSDPAEARRGRHLPHGSQQRSASAAPEEGLAAPKRSTRATGPSRTGLPALFERLSR